MKIANYGIRKAAVKAYLSGKDTQQELADILGFHRTATESSLSAGFVRTKKSGSLSHKSVGICPEFSLEERERPTVMVKAKLGITLQQIREAFSKNYSLMAVHSELKRLGFRYKKR